MKKLVAFLLVFVMVLGLAACGGNEEESKPAESKPAESAPAESTPAESTPEESSAVEESKEESKVEESSAEPVVEKVSYNFLKTASSVTVDGTVTGESVVIFTNDEAIANGNAKWSTNVLLAKKEECLYEVISSTPGDGNVPAITLEEGQILLAVHSDSTGQNKDGKAAATALAAGDLIAIVGIPENDIQLLKTYEEGKDKLEYVKPVPKNIAAYVSFSDAAIGTGQGPEDTTSFHLTGVNVEPEYGASIIYTSEGWNATLGTAYDWSEFEIFVAEYDHPNTFQFQVTNHIAADEASDVKAIVEVPSYGFVLAISKNNEKIFKNLKNFKETNHFYVHGLSCVPRAESSWTALKCDEVPTIDGELKDGEWDNYSVSVVDIDNIFWDYSQFDKDNYGVTGEIYLTWDDENLYFAVRVNTTEHSCPYTQQSASSMWNRTCIQVNVMNQSPYSEYVAEHFDHAKDGTAVSEGVLRQYGFAVNDDGDTINCVWMGNGGFTGECKVTNHIEDLQQLIYEVSIPWSEVNVEAPAEGTEVSVAFSLNCAVGDKWTNVRYLDGGGIIGRNDWAKMPLVTLAEQAD